VLERRSTDRASSLPSAVSSMPRYGTWVTRPSWDSLVTIPDAEDGLTSSRPASDAFVTASPRSTRP
jgi:hypothetical protein